MIGSPGRPSASSRVDSRRASGKAARASSGTLDLAAIETSLRALQGALPAVNRSLLNDHPPLQDASLGAMLAGYAELDRLAHRDIDLFARGARRSGCSR